MVQNKKKWLRLCLEGFGTERSAMDSWDAFGCMDGESIETVPVISEKWMEEDMRYRVQDQNIQLSAYIEKLHVYINEIETREKNLIQSLLSVPLHVWVTLQRPDTGDVEGFLSVHRSKQNQGFVFTLKPVGGWVEPSISISLPDACFAWCMQRLHSHDTMFRSLLWFRVQGGSCFTLCFSTDSDRAKFDTMFRNA
tara:strand:+ start:2315 stop:2899 length:585 start_codon:yes stop_codon:yes gene_type:complete